VIVVQAKKAIKAMLKPAPSVASRMNCGRMRLMIIHTIVIVRGLIAAIQMGKDVLPDATKIENRMDAIMMKIRIGA